MVYTYWLLWNIVSVFKILREYFVSTNAGMIDADFRGIIQTLILNHHPEKVFTVGTGGRIAQVVFMERFNANFHRVTDQYLSRKTKRESDGLGSKGVTVIKKVKRGDDDDDDDDDDNGIQLTTSENSQVKVNSEDIL